MIRRIIISLIVALVLFLVLAIGIFLLLKFAGKQPVQGSAEEKEQTMEEKIQSVTAPEITEPPSQAEQKRIEKLLKSVTAP